MKDLQEDERRESSSRREAERRNDATPVEVENREAERRDDTDRRATSHSSAGDLDET